jgi:hypothetical protein
MERDVKKSTYSIKITAIRLPFTIHDGLGRLVFSKPANTVSVPVVNTATFPVISLPPILTMVIFLFYQLPIGSMGGRLMKKENNKVLYGSVFYRKVAMF